MADFTPADATPTGGAATLAEPALENITDNSSPPRLGLDGKWPKHEWLRLNSVVPRQRICLTRAYDLNVSVRMNHDAIGLSGLMACGSRQCPVCGPRLASRNRDEIVQAVRAWREGEGGTVLFGTFTLRHHSGQRFDELKEGISLAWARVTGGKGWVTDRRRHGVEHWIRVFEEKWSEEFGWHLHVHYLVFLSPDAPGGVDHVDRLLRSMFSRWRSAALARGLGTPALKGQDLHEVTGEDADRLLGDYFSKQAAATETKTAESIGYELTLRDAKFSNLAKRKTWTPGELLTLAAFAGDEHARLLWAEYERGQHKRRVIAFSRGLRARVGIGDEISDEDAAQMEGPELMATVLEMRARQFKKVQRFGKKYELLSRVWKDGPEATVAWLDSWGVTAVVGDFDTYGQEASNDEQQDAENQSPKAGGRDEALSLPPLPY